MSKESIISKLTSDYEKSIYNLSLKNGISDTRTIRNMSDDLIFWIEANINKALDEYAVKMVAESKQALVEILKSMIRLPRGNWNPITINKRHGANEELEKVIKLLSEI